ncbi:MULTISPECIES: ABC transporter permease [Tatumella]|uniref:Transport permease protein n=1 Tax=Tatumella punctata TaxID=399969 RepID=A0ABW1VKQ9_9GAMM|nr:MULTISPECIES: ABC transporter permease [unclassified Tatumella]MBS0878439.1 ABC transporter permease [Tatumella sp. JGM82]MBS0892015.1 ABC transporter permease [Tatumella sp. JGM94]MBS0903133.1 ABC transporter permease [Tatumella sp. JGM100]
MKYKTVYLFDLLYVMTAKELKVRYKSSFLGYIWSVANPLLFAMIYYFIFKVIMRVNIPDYTLFIITALFPWQWFSSSLSNSLFSFLSNAQIIKKTIFPRSVIPLSNVIMEGIHFLCTLPVIMVFMLIYHRQPDWIWLWGVPLLMNAQIILSFGFSLLFSSINLFFRDMERFVTLGLMLMFYCTPILYASDMIPERFQWVINYNPVSELILSWRNLLMNNQINYLSVSKIYIMSILILVFGMLVFNKLKFRFAEIL